ncbi:histidine kinase [Maribellus sediminis]|uniref:histidine kinase n=1 Tax=Maribellus sediminis TaxID=2696285 RepID=UPI001430BACF|nr:histidine kinase [Maribellus sediminis]
MKKINLLLFLICILFQTSYLTAGNADEKIDLSPKIKKGDSWNMVFNLDTDIENLMFFDTLNVKNIATLKKLKAVTDWKVQCLEISDSVIKLKYTLERFKVQSRLSLGADTVVLFNDSDYPIFEKDIDYEFLEEIIGKSMEYLCENGKGSITKNEFTNEILSIPVHNISNDIFGNDYGINLSINLYGLLGPKLINYSSTLFTNVLSFAPEKIGKRWKTNIQISTSDSIINDTFDSQVVKQDSNIVYIQIEGQRQPFLADVNLGIPFVFPDNICFIYNFPNLNNTRIRGNVENTDYIGEVKLDIFTPLLKKDTSVLIENGKFNIEIDLNEHVFAYLTFNGKRKYSLLIRPGMQVDFKWEKGKKFPKITGFGADDMEFILKYYASFPPYDYQPYFWQFSRDTKNLYNKYLKEFDGKLSTECLQFLKEDSTYKVGFMKVLSMISRRQDRDFFAQIDSIPLLSFNSELLPNYYLFSTENRILKLKTLKKQIGGVYNDKNYDENIQFAKIMYKGYPMYQAIYSVIRDALLNGDVQIIQKYYNDFLQFPIHPKFKDDLKKLYSGIETLQKGNPIPVTSFYDFEKGEVELKSGELQILDINVYEYSFYQTIEGQIRQLEDLIRLDNRIDKINITVIRPESSKGKFEEYNGKKSVDVTYIYLPEDKIKQLKLLQLNNKRRTLFLDKNLNILDNNFASPFINARTQLPKILDDYFESLNQPKLKADTRRLLLFILVSLVCFGFLTWLIIRVRTQKISKREAAKRKLSELELRAIRSQMNPHFMFNALNSIQNLVNKSKIEASNIYLSEFAEMMRLVLNNSEKQLVPLEEEMKLIKSYLELEKLRIPFEFEIIIDPDIHPEEEEIPGMLIQPFVENAVIHGIAPQKGGEIKVAFTKTDHKICCEITDNGMGISKRSEQRNGNGKAIKMLEERIKIVNSQTTEKLTFEIIDRNKMNEKGTLVRIEIPV